MTRHDVRNIFIIGSALFAMFFGAGNFIFPPFLGFNSGTNWLSGAISFVLIDVGLSLLGLFVVVKLGKDATGVTAPLGKVLSTLILVLNVVCIGPIIAIPRTAATTYELSIAPLFPGIDSWVFSIAFFLLVIILCLKPSRAVDIVGTVLCPIMVIAILALIFKGIATPLGVIQPQADLPTVVRDGVLSGYQTMDMMAALIFSSVVITSITLKGYTEPKLQFRIFAWASLLSGAALFLIYSGLTYLGATASALSSLFPSGITQTELLNAISFGLLGKGGATVLAVIVAMACLTTAIGLVSSASDFFFRLSNCKIPYIAFVFLFSAISCLFSNLGISKIISFAAPILDLIYPVLLVLIVLGLFGQKLPNYNVHRCAALGALLVSVLSLLESHLHLNFYTNLLPLAEFGFGWLLPTLLFGAIGALLPSKHRHPHA